MMLRTVPFGFIFFAIVQGFSPTMNEISNQAVSDTAKTSGEGRLKLIVCQGSSCYSEDHRETRAERRHGEGRCRGMFNPKTELLQLAETRGSSDIDIEEVYCMNLCKKGPNVRMVLGGDVVTFPSLMTEIEQRRKAFTGIGGDPGVQRVWGAATSILDGAVQYETHGPPPET